MPEPRQTFSFHGFRFEVLRKRHNRIAALRIRPLAPPETGTKAMGQAREAEGEGRSAMEELGGRLAAGIAAGAPLPGPWTCLYKRPASAGGPARGLNVVE